MRFNKKGISEIVSYVLLIVLGLGLATATYFFLSGYVNPFNEGECPDGVAITVTNYTCGDNHIDITLKNNGRFNLAGVIINGINNSDGTEFQLYDYPGINVSNSSIVPRLSYVGPLNELVLYPYIVDKEGYNRLCEKALTKIKVNTGLSHPDYCTCIGQVAPCQSASS